MRAILILMLGCASLITAEEPPKSGLAGTVERPAQAQPEPVQQAPTPESESIELREKAAQLMLVTLGGFYAPSGEDSNLLKQYTPGGVVIPAIARPAYAADYIELLRSGSTEARRGIPLLIGTNVYGLIGGEHAASSFFVQLPSLLSLAAARAPGSAARLGGLLGDCLTAMGFNLNLGPSLDLAPTLPGARGTVHGFGSSAAFAAEAGGALVEALAAKGILAMPMGFPGGGANKTATSPATLLTPRARLAEEDLLPYISAIEQGAEIIHVGPTLAGTIDPNSRPACLSPAVMRDLLRGTLGFKGLIVAGPVDAPEIKRLYDPALAALMALDAGADMIYWQSSGDTVIRGIETVVRAAQERRYGGVAPPALNPAIIDAAVERILTLKMEHKLIERKPPNKKNAEAISSKNRYPKESYSVERQSITVVKNQGNILPLTKEKSTPLGITGIVGVEELYDALEKPLKYVVQQPIATAKQVGDIEDFEIARLTTHNSGIRTVVCLFTDTRKTGGQVRLIRALKQNGARVIVVLLGYPTNLPALADADAIMLAYCDENSFGQSIRAVADTLLGEGSVGVLPPVRDMKTRAGKPETFNAADVVQTPAGRLPVTLADPFVAGYAVRCDPTHAIKKAVWDFGDGGTAKKTSTEYAYKTAGQYTVTLTVTDQRDEVTSGTFNVVVE